LGRLLRTLGRTDALAIGVGGVIGAGVFRTTGIVVAATPGFAVATALWLLGGVVSVLGALVYGDLATRVPEAGGPYAYVRDAFGRAAGFTDGWLHAGVGVPARQAASFGALGGVLAELTGVGHPRALGAAALAAIVGVTLAGVRAGARVQRALTAAKLVAIAGVVALAFLPARHAPAASEAAAPAAASLATAMAGIWFTFLGWSDVALLAEELREPRRDLPFVLMATVLVVTGVYVAFQAAVWLGLGGGAAAASDFPALRMAESRLGAAGPRFLAAVALVSMVGGVAEGLLVRPRIAFALARDGLGPQVLARVDARGTPWVATLAHAAVVLGLLASGTFADMLLLLTFAQAAAGLLEAASWFRIARRVAPVVPCPGAPWVPLAFTAANGALCVGVGVASPRSVAVTVAAIGALAVAGAAITRTGRRAGS
jgi:APA family basic amino acid/polyamine antiporter